MTLALTLSLALMAGISIPADALLQKYVDTDGMVNYAAWKDSEADQAALRSYLGALIRAARSRRRIVQGIGTGLLDQRIQCPDGSWYSGGLPDQQHA